MNTTIAAPVVLSNQETIFLFSKYLQSNVYYRDYSYLDTQKKVEEENKRPLNYLRNLGPATFTSVGAGSITSRDVTRLRLLVKPLGKMSEEDARHICLLFKKDYQHAFEVENIRVDYSPTVKLDKKILSIGFTAKKFHANSESYYTHNYIIQITNWGSIDTFMDNQYCSSNNAYAIYETLFLLGYAAPLYFGPGHPANFKDAIELNRAIDATLLPENYPSIL
jgi:hypothetical protein